MSQPSGSTVPPKQPEQVEHSGNRGTLFKPKRSEPGLKYWAPSSRCYAFQTASERARPVTAKMTQVIGPVSACSTHLLTIAGLGTTQFTDSVAVARQFCRYFTNSAWKTGFFVVSLPRILLTTSKFSGSGRELRYITPTRCLSPIRGEAFFLSD